MRGNRKNHPRKYAREEDIHQLIGDVQLVKENIQDIRDNHLATIHKTLSNLQGRLDILIPIVIAILTAIIGLAVYNLIP